MTDIKQLCLDISSAAMALFDMVDEKGVDEPLVDENGPFILKKLLDPTFEIKEYYLRRSIQRMLALGYSPEMIARMQGQSNV